MIYQNGNKWIYEHNGEVIAVEYSREMAKACGDARVKAMQPNNASSGLACTCRPNSHGVHSSKCPQSPYYNPANR